MKNTNLPINLKDNNFLIENDFIMITKAGKLWRCGKGYRKDWDKLIGKLVLLHGQAFILVSRIKQDGKWYLVFKDEKHIYTERQDKALHNKNLAKDTIVEELMEEVKIPEIKYQLCLPSARTDLDFIIENELNPLVKQFNKYIINDTSNYTKKTHVLKKCAKDRLIELQYFNNENTFIERFDYIYELIYEVDEYPQILDKYKSIVKKCMMSTHPDKTRKDTSYEFNKLNLLYKLI